LSFFYCLDNVSDTEGNLPKELEADISEGNTSTEVEAGGVSSDEDIEENDYVWLGANATPISKSCSNKPPQ